MTYPTDAVTFSGDRTGVRLHRGLREAAMAGDATLLLWGRPDAGTLRLARLMLAEVLADPQPPVPLIRAFASEVVARLPTEGFELTGAEVLAWVQSLGTSQEDDLREEQRPERFDELREYDDDLPDAASLPGDGTACRHRTTR